MSTVAELGARAKAAAPALAILSAGQKNQLLAAIADTLRANQTEILTANQMDLEQAEQNGMPKVMQDRLLLDAERLEGIAKSIETVIMLADPVGELIGGGKLPNGLTIQKVRVPMGVVGIIFESRPNVTVDAAVLCLKSGNAAFLRGGKEAIHTNIALANSMRTALKAQGLPEDLLILLEDTDRAAATAMMQLNGYLDVLIPRGGAGLIQSVVQHATVPVIETGVGNCHTYVDATADLDMAVNIVNNAKTSRPSVCNACESLLVHRDVAEVFLPKLQQAFTHPVELRGCARTCAILAGIAMAAEEDYGTEFLDYILSVKVVDSVEDAIQHINRYSTRHSECIITRDLQAATRFTQEVDAAAVYVNASTRFTDGAEFGLGAEIGISTQKLHARGPMGLEVLTTIKYVVQGNGQIR